MKTPNRLRRNVATTNHAMLIVVITVLISLRFSTALFAQAQVRVIHDQTIIWRTDTAVRTVVTTVSAGTVLTVAAHLENWYEVIIPESLGGHGEHGLIAESQVEIIQGAPQSPPEVTRQKPAEREPRRTPAQPRVQPPDSRPAPTSSSRIKRTVPKGILSFDGGYRLLSTSFQGEHTFRVSGENAESHTRYAVKPGPIVGGSIGFMASSNLGLAVAFSRFARSTPALLTASIPNPFFFGQARTIAGEIAGLRQEELAVHAQGRGSFYLGRRFQVSAFGGPTIFRLKQSVVTDFTYRESYPYLEASFGAAQTVSETKVKVGFNAGADGAFYFTRHLGIGIGGMFSRASVEFTTPAAGTLVMNAGGAQVGAGMRIRF